MDYQPDPILDPVDALILAQSGPEPRFDPVQTDFLLENHQELKSRLAGSSIAHAVSLGRRLPWLYRVTLQTRSLARSRDGAIAVREGHTVAIRLTADYLRNVNRFATLAYVGPRDPAPFHPNIDPNTGAICLEVYPGEPVLEVVHSLHDLLRWRIRELREEHAFNHEACRYGRQHVMGPLDDRPLLGERRRLEILTAEERP